MNGFGDFYKNYLRTAIVCALIIVVVVITVLYLDRRDQYRIENDTNLYEKFFYRTNDAHKPLLNPNPKYYLTIIVTGDADLLKQLQPHFIMQYGAWNNDCMENDGGFSTGSFNPYIDVMQWAGEKRSQPYVFVFALDRYQRGACNWRVSALSSSDASDGRKIFERNTNTIFSFIDDESVPLQQQGGGTFICNKKLLCHRAADFNYFKARFYMPLSNYTYFLNFIKQQED